MAEKEASESLNTVKKESIGPRSFRLVKDIAASVRANLPKDDNPESASTQEIPNLPPFRVKHSWALTALLAFPYMLILVFILAQFWDFNGIAFTYKGYRVQLDGLLTTLTVSGLIGFATNWVAITMLFQPRKPRPILGYGLIPAQKERIAYRLAHAVTRDLINPELIRKKVEESGILARYKDKALTTTHSIISNPGFRNELKLLIVDYAEDVIGDAEFRASLAKQILDKLEEGVKDKNLERVALKAYRFVKGDDAQKIIEASLAQIPSSVEKSLDKLDTFLDQLPEKLANEATQVEQLASDTIYQMAKQLDIKAMIEQNLNRFDEQQLERLLKSTTNEQLKYIQYLGAVLGTIGGFVIWSPVPSILAIGSILGLVVVADVLLYRVKNG